MTTIDLTPSTAIDPEIEQQRGLGLMTEGRFAEAVDAFDRVLACAPTFAPAYFYRGVCLLNMGRVVEAAASYDAAAHLHPSMFEAHNNLGIALQMLGKFDGALTCHDRAIDIAPNVAELHNCRGNCLVSMDRMADARAAFERGLAIDPDHPQANNNLAILLHRDNRHAESLSHYERAIASAEVRGFAFDDARYNRGLLLLTLGDFERGWVDYEYRLPAFGTPLPFPLPFGEGGRASGEPGWVADALEGAHIYVRAEQGYGDTLQFVRYLPMLRDLGARVTFECQPGMRALIEASNLSDDVVERDPSNARRPGPEGALSTYIQSLPHFFGTDFTNMPSTVPYLRAPTDRRATLAKRIESIAPRGNEIKRVGIVWASGFADPLNRHRSCSVSDFAPLAAVEGVHIFSLQKGAFATDASTAAFPLTHLGDDFTDFADTAAALEQMDLLVSVDTSVAHLAGGLGVPTWTLLPWCADWRWFLDRDDSPWYPSMRLFRQPSPGDWSTVFARVVEALRQGHRP